MDTEDVAGVAGLPEASDINGCDGSEPENGPTETTGNPAECRTSKPGFVYFIRAGEAIKIGYSKDAYSRMADLQVANAETLEFMGSVKGDRQYESDLHDMFCHLQIRGEWFSAEPELIDFIDDLAVGAEPTRLPPPSKETLAAIAGLIKQRDVCGAETSRGYALSTLVEQLRHMEFYVRPDWAKDERQTLPYMIQKKMARIASPM
jgi:hypothetical protein